MNSRLKSKIKKPAEQKGADLMGGAPVAQFQVAPKGFHPQDQYLSGQCYSA